MLSNFLPIQLSAWCHLQVQNTELPTAATLENILKHTKLAFIAALKQLHHTDRIAPKKTQLGKTCEIHSFKSLIKQAQRQFWIYHSFRSLWLVTQHCTCTASPSAPPPVLSYPELKPGHRSWNKAITSGNRPTDSFYIFSEVTSVAVWEPKAHTKLLRSPRHPNIR